ncbi:MAG: methionyl-tRNA formyltransferase [Gammaproteobacteria bacterium]
MKQDPPRIVFAGTPAFAAASLAALCTDADGAWQVVGVYTQPDRPAGRGRKLQPSPVKSLALARGLPVFQPSGLRDAEAQQTLAGLKPDLMVVAAYGLLLPPAVLAIPRLGCVNVHASVLPRWRGAAPIERAIAAGDTGTGITIMQMDAGLDTGAMLLVQHCAILPTDTGGSLRERLTALGARALLEAMPGILAGTLHGAVQDDAAASYARKLRREEALIDWQASAEQLARRVRAFNPANPCWTQAAGEALKVWEASAEAGTVGVAPGTILSASREGIRVACGEGSLQLTVLQPAGARAMSVTELLNGRARLFAPGTRLG